VQRGVEVAGRHVGEPGVGIGVATFASAPSVFLICVATSWMPVT
jgi:hypothetical protein